MSRILWNIGFVFCTLFMLTFEFDYSIFPSFYHLVNPIFELLVSASGTLLFGLNEGFSLVISSDTIGLYIHCFNLFLLSIIFVLILELILNDKEVNLRPYLLKILTYYLSLQLLIYGFDKVFKAQFFLPEPNTLFTPLKDISKDLLYWSTIGISRGYSIFLGMAEVITALFLLFRKTRLIGIVLGIGILSNVVAVNFSFDISVKVYSLFLLIGFLVLFSPYFSFFGQVFLKQIPAFLPKEKELFFINNYKLKRGIKGAIILLFLVEGFYPFVKTNNFNDDTFPRPKFHGAYEIINSESELKNVFIHRKGYLIFKNTQDEFQDFQLEIDSVNSKLLVYDYENRVSNELIYTETKNKLTQLKGVLNKVDIDFKLREIPLNSNSILEDGFHWISN